MISTFKGKAVTMVAGAGLITASLGGAAFASTPPMYQPYVILSSYYGHPGDSVSVQGHGYGGYEAVTVSFNGQTMTAHSDGSGNFSSQMTIANMRGGSYNVNASGNDYHENATTNYTVAGYYGTAQPSSYYVLPRHGLSISGQSFMPNEPIEVKDTTSGVVYPAMNADANGNFSTNSYMVAYNQANTNQTFMVTGMASGSVSTFIVSVGTYYPTLNPSIYYVMKGGNLTLSGMNFAPFEGVRIFINGTLAARATAGGNGAIQDVTIPVPTNSSSFTLTATGMEVGDSASATISVQQ